MTLLDQHEVTVQRFRRVRSPHGTVLEEDGPPITGVRCSFRELSSVESTEAGLVIRTFARVLARDWPGDDASRVFFRGAWWETKGSVLTRDGSEATRHFEINLVRIPTKG